MLINLFVFITFGFIDQSLAAYSVKYVSTDLGSIENSCDDVCSAVGLQCFDEVYQSMNCEDAAKQLCETESYDTELTYSRQNNYLQCGLGGCFVGCPPSGYTNVIYSNRELKFARCSEYPVCQTSHQSSFSQVCACYEEEETEPVTFDMSQIIGISLAITFSVGICFICALYYYFVKRNDDFIDETSFTDFLVAIVTCKECWDFVLKKGSLSKSSNTGHVELSSSDQDVSNHSKK